MERLDPHYGVIDMTPKEQTDFNLLKNNVAHLRTIIFWLNEPHEGHWTWWLWYNAKDECRRCKAEQAQEKILEQLRSKGNYK